MLYFIHLYDRYDKSYIFFFCFISFLGLLGIFMAMINIVRIELIGATEYCLLNSVSARLFLPTELFLIHPILI